MKAYIYSWNDCILKVEIVECRETKELIIFSERVRSLFITRIVKSSIGKVNTAFNKRKVILLEDNEEKARQILANEVESEISVLENNIAEKRMELERLKGKE